MGSVTGGTTAAGATRRTSSSDRVPAPAPPPAPDGNYLAVLLHTQQLQHQLALAEQRNQHLLAQQALMQQLVDVLRAV